MRFESYLSTHTYYGFDITPYLEKDVLNNKISWVKEFKSLIDKNNLVVKVIDTIKGNKLVVYMYDGFNDEFKKDGTSIIDSDFVNFQENDLEDFEKAFSAFKNDVSVASKELKDIIKDMRFVDFAHHIYFIQSEEEE